MTWGQGSLGRRPSLYQDCVFEQVRFAIRAGYSVGSARFERCMFVRCAFTDALFVLRRLHRLHLQRDDQEGGVLRPGAGWTLLRRQDERVPGQRLHGGGLGCVERAHRRPNRRGLVGAATASPEVPRGAPAPGARVSPTGRTCRAPNVWSRSPALGHIRQRRRASGVARTPATDVPIARS